MRRNKKLPESCNSLETKGTNFLKLHHLYICMIDEKAQLFYFVFCKISHKGGVISNYFDHYHNLKFTCDFSISLRPKSTHSCNVWQINTQINKKAESFWDFRNLYDMQKQLKEFLNMASLATKRPSWMTATYITKTHNKRSFLRQLWQRNGRNFEQWVEYLNQSHTSKGESKHA